ncbi:MAG TPA: DUF5683 domain-containing protein [Chitinophagaceae bacterium]|nr:DUF5683 domain-containing protein [Chitinophagaceae bacterium]
MALLTLTLARSYGQQKKDSAVTVSDTLRAAAKKTAADTVKAKKKRSEPGKAALRSAILPGWGQAYNKKYWKLPIVYGALAVPVIAFNYNNTWYQKTREAYEIRYTRDTARYDEIDPSLQPLSTESLQIYRNEFRQNMDFSVLAFLIIWGLQVADAAVDAHLRSFNISDDLSLKVKPTLSPGMSGGVSLILTYREPRSKTSLTGY